MLTNFVIPGFADSVKLSITSARQGIALRLCVLESRLKFVSILLVSSINQVVHLVCHVF